MNKLPFLQHNPFVITHGHFGEEKKTLLEQTKSLSNVSFVSGKLGRKSPIIAPYLESFLGCLI